MMFLPKLELGGQQCYTLLSGGYLDPSWLHLHADIYSGKGGSPHRIMETQHPHSLLQMSPLLTSMRHLLLG